MKQGNSEQRYLANFEAFEKGLNGEASSQVHAIRRAAIARFAELGFPTTRDEEWKYTDVSKMVNLPFGISRGPARRNPSRAEIEPLLGFTEGSTLVWVDAHFSAELSSTERLTAGGVKAGSLISALQRDPGGLMRHFARYAAFDTNAFTALSTAFFQDGAFVSIPDGAVSGEPIHLLFVSTGGGEPSLACPHNLYLIGRNSQASIVESHSSLAPGERLTNGVTEIVLGENALLEYHQIQDGGERAYHVGSTHILQERSSSFTSHSVSLGGALIRNNITAVLNGEGAECTLNGLYCLTGDQHVDNHTAIDHAKPHCNSHELYKGILDGHSSGVFNGKIMVRKDAQKTDAKQTNKNLVLSDDARIDTKPQLEIFASDVRCTHGATIGQLDDEALFYLQSRGIGAQGARDILIGAFAADVVDRIKIPALRDRLSGVIRRRLETGRASGERR
jgi:Fe-S cluster assembly protein SufD